MLKRAKPTAQDEKISFGHDNIYVDIRKRKQNPSRTTHAQICYKGQVTQEVCMGNQMVTSETRE